MPKFPENKGSKHFAVKIVKPFEFPEDNSIAYADKYQGMALHLTTPKTDMQVVLSYSFHNGNTTNISVLDKETGRTLIGFSISEDKILKIKDGKYHFCLPRIINLETGEEI